MNEPGQMTMGQNINDDHARPAGRAATRFKTEGTMDVWIEDGRVVLAVQRPATRVSFTPDQALEVAVSIMKHARRAGLKEPMVWRVGEPRPRSALNLSKIEGGPL